MKRLNVTVLIPIGLIKWSENCARKIANNKAKAAVDSCFTYKIFNVDIGDFNKQE
jgi:hypothetical protein